MRTELLSSVAWYVIHAFVALAVIFAAEVFVGAYLGSVGFQPTFWVILAVAYVAIRTGITYSKLRGEE